MKGMLFRGVVRPLLERGGTMIAAYLIARGIESDTAAIVVNGIVALPFVLLDLLTASVNRQKDEQRLWSSLVGSNNREGA